MINKLYIALFVLTILTGLVGAAVFFYFAFFALPSQPAVTQQEQTPPTQTTANTPTPVTATQASSSVPTGTTNQTISIRTSDGSILKTNDFIHNGTTIPSMTAQNSYILAGPYSYCSVQGVCQTAAPSTDFSVSYNQQDSSFVIGLLAEPISQSRKDAEQFLTQQLGLSQPQLCALNYYVGVSEQVNPIYDGENLGFSFCQGAAQLP